MRQEDIPIDELFRHVGEVFALRSEESDVGLELPAATTTHIRGDFDRLEQVMNNLLDNAFRHTPRTGRIRVATSEPRVLSGFNAPIPLVPGPGLEYRIGPSGSFSAARGTLMPGQSLTLRHTTSKARLGYTKTYLKAGGVTGYFLSRTR